MAAPNAPGAMNQPQKNGTPVAIAIKPGMPTISRADVDNPHFFNTDRDDIPLAHQRYILVATDRVKDLNGNEVYINVGARLTGESSFRAGWDIQYAYLANSTQYQALKSPPIAKNNTNHVIATREAPNLAWVDRYKTPSGLHLTSRRNHGYTPYSREVAIRKDWEEVFKPTNGQCWYDEDPERGQ
ncbi:unnamed protein product [Zymoseptoria tritici ST99CH_1E4]|uniref:Uncharacterized protein n=1 Tax=Zymoseptoria tritici ST99CH_1E4 TaxID=1276532 RepID=A0A2H1G4J3_ZYMTR|nr:unnamed protein product [Zymoseptoria tritici ST99CH_1E4]